MTMPNPVIDIIGARRRGPVRRAAAGDPRAAPIGVVLPAGPLPGSRIGPFSRPRGARARGRGPGGFGPVPNPRPAGDESPGRGGPETLSP